MTVFTFNHVERGGVVHIADRIDVPWCLSGTDALPGRRVLSSTSLTCMTCLTAPWIGEPDAAAFVHSGYRCTLERNQFGAWCGYVHVRKDHPITKTDDAVHTLSVHGGVTYNEECDDYRVLGFDCVHFSDCAPLNIGAVMPPAQYRTFAFAKAEVKHLAEQLAAYEALVRE